MYFKISPGAMAKFELHICLHTVKAIQKKLPTIPHELHAMLLDKYWSCKCNNTAMIQDCLQNPYKFRKEKGFWSLMHLRI